MRIGIVCKVIDNYGDAGFSLRLGRALAGFEHDVVLFNDNPETFSRLYPDHETDRLTLVDAGHANFSTDLIEPLDLLLEPFGTSSEQTLHRFDLSLKVKFPNTPWLVIDYLSAESWVEDFHLSSSMCPGSGHKTSYFYPGFTSRTGGLLHCDYPARLRHQSILNRSEGLRIFVFSYPDAPLHELLEWATQQEDRIPPVAINIAGRAFAESGPGCIKYLPFCAQSRFDDLLAQHDVLFVRGEDSFVRAQLAGLPMIWQIYPTQDNAHADKLASFFRRYSTGLSADCASALWNCWAGWNNLPDSYCFSRSWPALQPHWVELHAHAIRWRDHLFQGPELVKEVLTWRAEQTPTLKEKTDL